MTNEEMPDDAYASLMEYAVWAILDRKNDLELTILKGHVILDGLFESVLNRLQSKDSSKYSFYRKIEILESTSLSNPKTAKLLIVNLKVINTLRNKIAHDFNFNLEDENLSSWSEAVLANLNGDKFSRYTYRTKIVHAFSTIAANLIRIS